MVEEAKQPAREPKKYVHYNLLIIGEKEVGKTSLMNQYLKKKFSSQSIATSGVDTAITPVYVLKSG